MTLYSIRPFEKVAGVASFRCGQAPLDEYILRYASQDLKRNVARVFIATPADDHDKLAGFFTLSVGGVSCAVLPESLVKKLPRYPVPVALIGRLAVDSSFQGKGLGSILLVDACRKVAQASSTLAVAGIVVEAKDAAAVAFYRHFGFLKMHGQPNRLLLPASAFLE